MLARIVKFYEGGISYLELKTLPIREVMQLEIIANKLIREMEDS